jgi:predicted nucleic acid-binding protein
MNKVIITDSSPLIAFGSIDQLSIVFKVFGKVIVPQTVANECLVEMMRPGACAISKAIESNKIQVHPPVEFQNRDEMRMILDEGEIDTIALAHSLNFPLIINEKLGRDAAKDMGIKIIGTVGILLLAKQKKITEEIKPILMQLKNGHYFLSDKLIKDALKRGGEK